MLLAQHWSMPPTKIEEMELDLKDVYGFLESLMVSNPLAAKGILSYVYAEAYNAKEERDKKQQQKIEHIKNHMHMYHHLKGQLNKESLSDESRQKINERLKNIEQIIKKLSGDINGTK